MTAPPQRLLAKDWRGLGRTSTATLSALRVSISARIHKLISRSRLAPDKARRGEANPLAASPRLGTLYATLERCHGIAGGMTEKEKRIFMLGRHHDIYQSLSMRDFDARCWKEALCGERQPVACPGWRGCHHVYRLTPKREDPTRGIR